MFEFLDMMNFGRVITAHGEKWQSIQYYQDGYHLAIKTGEQSLPVQCYLVKQDSTSSKQPDTVDK